VSVFNLIALASASGVTVAGLVASWFTGRRRGLAAGLRGAAWSLLPVAAYLTGVLGLLWRFGTAIARFATAFVFSPFVWTGIAVAGLAALLFVVSGALRRRRGKGGSGGAIPAVPGQAPGKALEPGRSSQPGGKRRAAAAADEDFGEVADILRKHGIR
jgi:MFS family permease